MGSTRVLAGDLITTAVLNRIYGQADTTAHTVTATSFTDLSTVYTIDAGDAAADTAYRLTTWGNGVQGSTQQALTFAAALAGTQIGTTPAIASTALAANAAFDFRVQVNLVCVSPGPSATWIAEISGLVTQSANPVLPGTAADNTVPFTGCTHTAAAQDSTVDSTFSVQAKWASATGAPTLTTRATLFERVN